MSQTSEIYLCFELLTGLSKFRPKEPMTSLAGPGFKTEEGHQMFKIVAALFVIMPAHYIGNMGANNFKINPNGMAT